MYKIIDNFLNENELKTILKAINNNNFFWFLIEKANYNSDEGDFQFMHTFIKNGQINSDFFSYCKPIYEKIIQIYKKPIHIGNARVNLFLKVDKKKGLGFHKDITDNKNVFTFLYYLENSNGYTEFENGDIIESKKNRAVFFNSDLLHQTVMQTDVLFRKNININFMETND